MALVLNVTSVDYLGSKARDENVEVPPIVNLEHYISQTPCALSTTLSFERANAESITQK